MQRQLVFWLIVGLCFLGFVALLRPVLLPFVAGVIIAYFLNPIADRLEAAGFNRAAAAAMIVILAAVVLIVAVVLLYPLLSSQIRQLAETTPGEIERFRQTLETWLADRLGHRFPAFKASLERALDQLSQGWSSWLGAIVGSLWSQGLAIVNFLSLLFVTPVVVFYVLVDWHAMIDRLDSWAPRDHVASIRRLAADVNEAVAAFVRGQGIVCLILGVFYAVALSLAGIRYGMLIGFATGLLAFIPYAGWALGFLGAAVIALVHNPNDWMPVAKVVGIFSAGMAIDSAVLSPKIVGQKIGLHPVWLIFALFSFSYLFGFVGLLVAVPVAAAVGVLVRHALGMYVASPLYRGSAGTAAIARHTAGDT
ncbi:MAG: AI-2E family transporter [Hyphomicrobiaceae bacterium]